MLRRSGVRGFAVVIVVLILGGAGAIGAAAAVPTTPAAPFDAHTAIAELGAAPIVRLPGAPARFDEAKIAGLLRGTVVKILLTPFEGVEKSSRVATDAQESIVRDWADEHQVQLILVIGLRVRKGWSSRPAIWPSSARCCRNTT